MCTGINIFYFYFYLRTRRKRNIVLVFVKDLANESGPVGAQLGVYFSHFVKVPAPV
jgi:hypothetical protein